MPVSTTAGTLITLKKKKDSTLGPDARAGAQYVPASPQGRDRNAGRLGLARHAFLMTHAMTTLVENTPGTRQKLNKRTLLRDPHTMLLPNGEGAPLGGGGRRQVPKRKRG